MILPGPEVRLAYISICKTRGYGFPFTSQRELRELHWTAMMSQIC